MVGEGVLVKHGELIRDGGQWSGTRYCEVCEYHYHGELYACEHYPEQVLAEIRLAEAKWLRELEDGTVYRKAMESMTEHEAAVFTMVHRVFAGLE